MDGWMDGLRVRQTEGRTGTRNGGRGGIGGRGGGGGGREGKGGRVVLRQAGRELEEISKQEGGTDSKKERVDGGSIGREREEGCSGCSCRAAVLQRGAQHCRCLVAQQLQRGFAFTAARRSCHAAVHSCSTAPQFPHSAVVAAPGGPQRANVAHCAAVATPPLPRRSAPPLLAFAAPRRRSCSTVPKLPRSVIVVASSAPQHAAVAALHLTIAAPPCCCSTTAAATGTPTRRVQDVG